MTDLGTILRDGERVGLQFHRVLRHSPERVWRALSEAEDLQQWFPVDIVGERRAGAPLRMPFWPGIVERYNLADEPVLDGELLTWEPFSLFEYRWDTEVLRWELTPHQDGTELVLTTWLVKTEHSPPAESAAAGYHKALDMLADTCAGASAEDLSESELEALVERYRPLVESA